MVRFQEEYIEEIAAGWEKYQNNVFLWIFARKLAYLWKQSCLVSGEFPGVIMTIVLRRKIQYHLLQVNDANIYENIMKYETNFYQI